MQGMGAEHRAFFEATRRTCNCGHVHHATVCPICKTPTREAAALGIGATDFTPADRPVVRSRRLDACDTRPASYDGVFWILVAAMLAGLGAVSAFGAGALSFLIAHL